MKKIITVIVGILVVFIVGYFWGKNAYVNGSIATIVIKNQGERSIMTATISHEKGSAITANIKKGHSQRTRFVSKGLNSYSVKVTFDDNRTIYSDSDRVIKNGDVIIETVTDSVIVSTTGK